MTTWANYARGPNDVRGGYKIDAKTMANDLAALAKALDTLVLSEFTASAADAAALETALINDIYSDSGFKYTGSTTVVNNKITPTKTQDSDSTAYQDLVRPGGNDYVRTMFEDQSAASANGTSGNDTITLDASNIATYGLSYFGLAGDDAITVGAGKKGLIYGGSGNDRIITTEGANHRLDGGSGNDMLGGNIYRSTLYGGPGNDVFVIDVDSERWNVDNNFSGSDRNSDGTVDILSEVDSRQGVIADFENGTDKIGLKGDWSGKTIIVSQGTGSYSAHTFLYQKQTEHGDADARIWAVIANTNASDITEDDFVLVDSSYATSTLSGVTISTTLADAGAGTFTLPSIAPVLPGGNSTLGDSDNSSSSAPLEGGTDLLVELEESGIDIDILVNTSALDVRSNESELSEILLETDTQNSEGYDEIRSDSSLYFHSTDLLEEEDILISFDAI